MGKLGKKARKFAKKNLQSVLKRKRKINSMIKKKHSSRGKGDATEDQVAASVVPPTGRSSEDVGDTFPDSIFSEDDSDSMGDSSDSDGFLSEDPSCAYNSESENEDESDKGGSSLSGNNKDLEEELLKEKKKLDRMREKDPKFLKFLDSQNVEQSKNDKSHSDGEGEISDEDMVDTGVGDSTLLKNKLLTVSAIESWKEQIMTKQNFSVLPNVLNAYRAACHYGTGDGFKALSCLRIKNSATFCETTMFMLQEADGIFRKMLGIGGSNCKAETVLGLKNTEKWKNLKPLIKSYIRSTLILLNHTTDSEILVFSLTHLRASVVLFAAFPSLLRRLIKVAVHLWATGGGSVSSSAFLLVQNTALRINSNCLETCLRKAYKAFISHCKIAEPSNLKHLQYLLDSLVELYSLDIQKSYDTAEVSIQQLARILQQGVKTKKKDVLKKIYNWQYTNCIDLWVKFISANIKDHDLQPLLYIIIQVINGVAHLFPGPRYLPLRLKCIQMLNQLSSATGLFIPITSLVLDCLEYVGTSKPDERQAKDFDVSAVLKVPKQWLKLKYFQQELVQSVIEVLAVHFSQWSLHISFPDLATFPLIRLRKVHEKLTAESLRRPVKRLIDQVQQNVDFVQKRRDEAAFSPKDLESIESFLQKETCGNNFAFIQYYASVSRRSVPRLDTPKKSTQKQKLSTKQQQQIVNDEKATGGANTKKVSHTVETTSSIDGTKRKKQRTLNTCS